MTIMVVMMLAGIMALLRVGGFALARCQLPAQVERSLSLLLIAALSALIVTGVAGAGQYGAALPALVLAMLCAWIWRRLWLTLVIGMAAFTLLARLLHEEVHL